MVRERRIMRQVRRICLPKVSSAAGRRGGPPDWIENFCRLLRRSWQILGTPVGRIPLAAVFVGRLASLRIGLGRTAPTVLPGAGGGRRYSGSDRGPISGFPDRFDLPSQA